MKPTNKKFGFAALTGVVILGIVATILLPSIILINTDNVRVETAIAQSGVALNLASACAETALNNLRNNNSYTGNATLTYPNGTCQIQTITGTTPNFTIQTTSTIGGFTKKIRVVTSQISPAIVLSSWQETDF
jgi:predicted RND superfamily exporter protein